MTTGTCLCGSVRFEFDGPLLWMAHCHCSMCRKQHGTLHGTTVGVVPQNFRWLQGTDAITRHHASANFARPFCNRCGSALPEVGEQFVVVPVGTLDDDPGMRPTAHIFVASRSPSTEIRDSLQQFDEYPPGFPSPSVERPPIELKEGVVQGGCLCGAVAFEAEELPTRMVNCHCSRCRRSRGTAHGTNVFISAARLRWVRGEERVKSYKVPEARVFNTAFCDRCGSQLPALFPRIAQYLVPVGSLDTPLPCKPAVHIYVDSKAPWYEFSDELPRFAEMPPRERLAEFMFDLPPR